MSFIRTVLSALTGQGIKTARLEAQKLEADAIEEKRKILLEGREEASKIRSQAEDEVKERIRELRSQEKSHRQREESIERRNEAVERKELSTDARESAIEQLSAEVEELKDKQIQELERVAGLTTDHARHLIETKAEEGMRHELAKRYYELEQEMHYKVDEEARKVITLAIQRLASDVVSERSTSKVPLPSDDMKGRLIGREGRNIRALESATGVDVLIDDTPEMVTISCFDPIRREVARVSLEKLIKDGRIHPARIEEIVQKSQHEVEETISRSGEEATFDAGVRGLHPELIKLLGRLKYRYSYGENILQHSVEVSLLCGLIAAEIGADIEVAKAGGLLHDIGKAMTHEVQGSHVDIGGDIAEKYGIQSDVHRAIVEHHEDDRGSVEALIVAAADAISAARPGARKESLEHYVERLEALEGVATSFPGVQKAYAIQAGREVRIIVKPEDMDDYEAAGLARDVAKRVEDELIYPGQVKITVVRETRSVEIAR
ncbi:ribonuclease Y [SAR202 cluster bacterium AD-804-J14_MRT_500m]|nr:ribonuclease Y [SAR202 cluster bacterium AD-804-J14_MRT_500m]